MTALTTFNTPFATELRVLDHDGAPWFIAKDVCEALGLAHSDKNGYGHHLKELPTGSVLPISNMGGRIPGKGGYQLRCVNESGFYKLVLKSRKPEARKFQDWVTGVVLPAIRKDGAYVMGEEKVATGEMGEDELLTRAFKVADRKLERLTLVGQP